MSKKTPVEAQLPKDERQRFEEARAGFEAAWRREASQGRSPSLAAFLPPAGPLRAALLKELAAIDMEFRKKQGEVRRWEDYVGQFPELQAPVAAKAGALEATVALAPDSTASVAATLAAPSSTSATSLPQQFGRYTIRKELGQGAMGAVYLAHDTELGRDVALKIPKFTGADAAALLERFRREARAAALLRHANLCPVYDVGQLDGQHYITMAFIRGRPLRDFIRGKKLQPERTAAVVVRKMALGLAEAHAHGVVHRDLKPANVMIDAHGEPVVMDFGLARRVSAEESHVTQSGMIVGTPAYMSPEQVAGDPARIGPAADIYSLGVILYELLAGQLPFRGDLMATLMQIASQEPPPPRERREELDPRLEAICLKMLAKSPADRYRSMTEVAHALGEYLKATKAESPAPAPQDAFQTMSAAAPTVAAAPEVSSLAAPVAAGEVSSVRRRTKARPERSFPGWAIVAAGCFAFLALCGAVTLYLRVGKVDVQVVIDDPRLAVRVEGDTVTFENAGEPIRLKPGEHTLFVERDGLEVETDRFTVQKEGKNVLRVSLVNDQVVIGKNGRLLLQAAPVDSPRPAGSSPQRFALEFDGDDDFIEIPTLELPDGPATIEVWMKLEDANHIQTIASAVGRNQFLSLYVQENAIGPLFGTLEKDGFWRPGIPAELRERLFHAAAVWDGQRMRAFIHGMDGGGVAPSRIRNTAHGQAKAWLGRGSLPGAPQHFQGRIAAARFSRGARYHQDFTPEERWTADADTLALYQFDEGQGAKLLDSSGNGHHGNIVGAKWVPLDAPSNEQTSIPIAPLSTPKDPNPAPPPGGFF